ncbi:MAG TPA: ATP-binding protein [Ramlibacter sp.]|jgi:two-component system CheB/CheR fusion protein|uniref:hybrid sensor histidine kinase/response regulator n=1 Tax=Ramlibacter sp. TaxID=1917967 RepID=UPI002D26B446|nr:ATP-binding protein [Ramlibacter sp.]HZY17884.1 ATP-binding protein [Ramlibacter sp.]
MQGATATATESRFEPRARSAASMVWITDADGCFTTNQPTWAAYTGQHADDHRGLGWQRALHPDDLSSIWRAWLAAREQRSMYVAEARVWHAQSGRYRRCEVRAVPDVEADGRVRGWVGTCVDVHERRSSDQALRIADRRKDEFMGVLAHELRNPLAPIRNAVHVLKVCREDDARSTWARSIIERQVEQMARLLDDLLDLTRITRGKLEVRRERLDLAVPLERAIETSRPLLDAQGHDFEVRLPSEPLLVDGDGPRLGQVFANLLNNAAKYTDRGGRICLSAAVEDAQAVVRIRDNGIGIDPAVLPGLFRLYAQAVPARDRAQGGLGIGLALVRGLIEMHGGSVDASSDGPGTGTEVVVRLPLLQDEEVLPNLPPAPRPPGSRGVRILIADDNHDAAQTLSVLLEVLGHEVCTASDGLEAVDLAGRFQPSVALLDIGMPRLDGYAAARRIRELVPAAVLIATTGWCRTEDLRRAAEAGFDHHLVKPIDPDQVARLVALAAQEGTRAAP